MLGTEGNTISIVVKGYIQVLLKMFSTVGNNISTVKGYYQVLLKMFSTVVNIISTVWGIPSLTWRIFSPRGISSVFLGGYPRHC